MDYTFETAAETDFEGPPGCEDWLYAAGFSPMLPDRLNVGILRLKVAQRFQGSADIVFAVDCEDGDPDAVSHVHVLFAPDQPEVAEWMAEQLYIIERDGILDEELYWPLVDPILQKLWEEASTPERMKLCAQGEVDPGRIFDEAVPAPVHAILYEQISD